MKRSSQVEIVKAIFSALEKQPDNTMAMADLASAIRIPVITIKRYILLIQAIQDYPKIMLENVKTEIHPIYQVKLAPKLEYDIIREPENKEKIDDGSTISEGYLFD
jgi:hypothetical protein